MPAPEQTMYHVGANQSNRLPLYALVYLQLEREASQPIGDPLWVSSGQMFQTPLTRGGNKMKRVFVLSYPL